MTIHPVLYYLIISCLLSGCAPSPTYYSWTSPEHDYKRFNKLAVFGITKDLQDASDFEANMVNSLRKSDYLAIQGMSVIPPEWMKTLDVKSVRQHLLSKGVEAVLSLAVVDMNSREIYVPGSVQVVPTGTTRFGSYYSNTYREIYQPGYYAQAQTFIYEANLYDLTLENVDKNVVWTYQYKLGSQSIGTPPLTPFCQQLLSVLNQEELL